jgi:hypothetical protein
VGLGLAAWTLRSVTALPIPLICALLGAAALEVGLGIGLLRRARAAWSFAVSLTAVLTLALVLALPAIHKSGASLVLGVAAALLVVTQLVLLILARRGL